MDGEEGNCGGYDEGRRRRSKDERMRENKGRMVSNKEERRRRYGRR